MGRNEDTTTTATSATAQQPRANMRTMWRAALLLAVAAIVAVSAACGGGKPNAADGTATDDATTTPVPTTTPSQNAGLKTPIPVSPGDVLTPEDLANRGTGTPGRGDFAGERLIIAKIGVDAPFTYRVVAPDGEMPNPKGPEDVAYYDFSAFPNLGGVPGKGGNVVVGGHVDYIRYGPAVFWRLRELQPGDIVTIRLTDGSEISYKIEFNKVIAASDADWSSIVAATADESITLITCGGVFEAGHYNNRQIAWGRRV